MNRTRDLKIAFSLLVVLAALLVAVYRTRGIRPTPTGDAEGARTLVGLTMGRIPFKFTAVSGTLDGVAVDQALQRAHQAMELVNTLMSTYRSDSDLSRLNAAEAGRPVRVHEELMSVLLEARRHTSLTDGAFDPTARGLFQLWKSAHNTRELPGDDRVASAKALRGWDKLTLDAGEMTAVKSMADMQIDLGAIAKGHAVDLALSRLRESGMAGALAEVGGEVRVFGTAPDGGAWRLGIRHPWQTDEQGRIVACGALALEDGAVATSGNYERFSVIDGKRYSHIIDPRTGRPVEGVASVTVIAKDCMTADIWATALSVLGKQGLQIVEDTADLEAMMIVGPAGGPEVLVSSGFAQYLHDGQPISLE